MFCSSDAKSRPYFFLIIQYIIFQRISKTVRILLSPQKKVLKFSGLFHSTQFLIFYSKTKFTLTFAVISISPIANVSLGADSSIAIDFMAYILGCGT